MATYQKIAKIQPGPRDPSRSGRQITPSNTELLPNGATRGIHCTGDAGIVLVIQADDAEDGVITPYYIAKGAVLPIAAVAVLVSADFGTVSGLETTATGLIAMY